MLRQNDRHLEFMLQYKKELCQNQFHASFWKKPNSMVAPKDLQIAAAPRSMNMKARRGERSRQLRLFRESELLFVTLLMQVMCENFVNGQDKTKSVCRPQGYFLLQEKGGIENSTVN